MGRTLPLPAMPPTRWLHQKEGATASTSRVRPISPARAACQPSYNRHLQHGLLLFVSPRPGAGWHVRHAERGKHAVGICDDGARARSGGDEGASGAYGNPPACSLFVKTGQITETRCVTYKDGLPYSNIRTNICTYVQPIPTDMRLLFSIGMPNFVLPNLDSVNHCTSKEISTEIKRYLLVQWLTESRFGKTKFNREKE